MPYARIRNPFFSPPSVSYVNPGLPFDELGYGSEGVVPERVFHPSVHSFGPLEIRVYSHPGQPGYGYEVYYRGQLLTTRDGDEVWAYPDPSMGTVAMAVEGAQAGVVSEYNHGQLPREVEQFFKVIASPGARARGRGRLFRECKLSARGRANPPESSFHGYSGQQILANLKHLIFDAENGLNVNEIQGRAAWISEQLGQLSDFGYRARDNQVLAIKATIDHFILPDQALTHEKALGVLDACVEGLTDWCSSGPHAIKAKNPYFAPPALSYTNPPELGSYTVREKGSGQVVAHVHGRNLDEARQRAASLGYSGRRFATYASSGSADLSQRGLVRNPGSKPLHIWDVTCSVHGLMGQVAAATKAAATRAAKAKFPGMKLSVTKSDYVDPRQGNLFGENTDDEVAKRLRKEASGGQEFLF